ncbi:alpha/beta hydrolase [Cupriavidus sp. TKC]|uniref:alpha/beta fold hydrolase n=1 Tax=Cupriavidus sp. TKC TaxID=2880159 RepID=UPI00295ECF54|nr:alpha/beta hydrolase [Cupriavidus sp. TKC]
MNASMYAAVNGVDLVLLHGLNNTPVIWRGVVDALPAHMRPHAPALPALPDVGAIADALLAQLPARFWLGGFSFGGYVAMAILERAPERVLGLAMLCTTPQADTPAQNLGRRAAIMAAASGDHVERTLMQGMAAFHPAHRDDADLLRIRREMVAAYGASTFIAHALASLMRPDRSALLRDDLPLLWVAGSADPLYPPQAIAALRAAAGHGQVHVIEPAGHLVPLEQPVELAAVLSAWIDGASAAEPVEHR